MKLPDSVLALLDRLEQAGFPCYAVGGCVRDWLLGLEPKDHDLCTAATPAEMKAIFSDCRLVLAGEKHGTVGVLTTDGVVEITTFRTEQNYSDNRHPDQVAFVRSIEEDLARRDFTVNAMAYSPIRGLRDPFGGREDLENHILRAVGDPFARFREDSLRILRGVRFSVRFGLKPEDATLAAMKALAPLLENLSRERVFDELCKLLPLVDADDLLTFAPVLTQAIPELAPMVGFQQHTWHHAYDVYTHTARTVEQMPQVLHLRWAALLHDIGKPATFAFKENGQGSFYGHAKVGAQMADAVLHRLKAPTALREQVVTLVAQHMTYPELSKKQIRRRLSCLGPQTYADLVVLQKADSVATGVPHPENDRDFAILDAILAEIQAENACLTVKDLAVNGHDLMALGFRGKVIGKSLNWLLEQVMDEQIENEKAELLAAVHKRPPQFSKGSPVRGAVSEAD